MCVYIYIYIYNCNYYIIISEIVFSCVASCHGLSSILTREKSATLQAHKELVLVDNIGLLPSKIIRTSLSNLVRTSVLLSNITSE